MNKKQYNNIITNTLKNYQNEDSLSVARAIFNNMGVALPQGNIKEVFEIIKTDNYMGWKSCTKEEAQAAANNGTAAIGINERKIVVLAADDLEEPVKPIKYILSSADFASPIAVSELKYYSYSCLTTNDGYIYFPNDDLEVQVGWTGYNSLSGNAMSTVCWGTSDSSVAEVNRYGHITTHKCGTVSIYAYTSDGHNSAAFLLTIKPNYKSVEKKKGFTWQINSGGVASYIVNFSLTCKITEVYSNMVKIEKVSAFIHTDKNAYALGTPQLSVGTTKLCDTVLDMSENESLWLDPNWIWDNGCCTLNSYIGKGNVFHSVGVAMLPNSPYGYRSIELELTV